MHNILCIIDIYLTSVTHLVLPHASLTGQCPAGTTISFEKISNVNIKGVNLVPLYQGMLEHMPVSAECNNRWVLKLKISDCEMQKKNYSDLT